MQSKVSEVLAARLPRNQVFWDVTLCCWEGGCRSFKDRSAFIEEGQAVPALADKCTKPPVMNHSLSIQNRNHEDKNPHVLDLLTAYSHLTAEILEYFSTGNKTYLGITLSTSAEVNSASLFKFILHIAVPLL